MSAPRLRANVGAEEPGGPANPAARAAGRLWQALFPEASWDAETAAAAWPPELRAGRGPAFDWLPERGLCAWWNDAASARAAARAGLALAGPPPEAVARVHDKAFAARVAEETGWTPRVLRGRIRCFEPEELRDPAAALARLRREIGAWPAELAREFTLKPRLGTSGRGRVSARSLDAPELAPALAGLAERGGALLEPWLRRTADYAVGLHVAESGELTVLGVLEQRTSRSGVYRGHRGELDHRGRVVSGGPDDDALLGAAAELARAAHAAGFHGPCGVDAFAFEHDGQRVLRPVVELNARFTMGTVVLGLLRRARAWIDAALAPSPGERLAFDFAFLGAGRARDREPPPVADGAARLALPDAVLSVRRVGDVRPAGS